MPRIYKGEPWEIKYRKEIRLITPEYIDEFVKEFERKMNEAK